jgi:iron complex outermembrane recepter protein
MEHRTIGSCVAVLLMSVALLVVGVHTARAGTDSEASADGQSASSTVSESQLQTIIVTAQKRTESIKDVPASISVVSDEELTRAHIEDFEDISRAVPGLSIEAGPAPGLENINIRGVSSDSGNATVGIYLDEIPLTIKNVWDASNNGTISPLLFDMDRVEVLRGPQGTLYGASSMGGTVRFITKQAVLDQVEASASTELSGTERGGFNHEETMVVNVPVVSNVFALRLSGEFADNSGYINHYQPTPNGYVNGSSPAAGLLTLNTNDTTGIVAARGVNDDTEEGFRLTGKYVNGESLVIVPSWTVQRTIIGDDDVFYPSIGLYDQDKRVAEPGNDFLSIGGLTLTDRIGAVELTWVTSYFERDVRRITDGTYYNSNVLAQTLVSYNPPDSPLNDPTLAIIGFLPSPVQLRTETRQFSEEVRLQSQQASLFGLPTNWVVGLYYAGQRNTHSDDEWITGLNSAFENIYGYNIYYSPVGGSSLPGVAYPDDSIYHEHLHETDSQIAPFADVEINLTSKLKGSLGVRYAASRESFGFVSSGYYGFGIPSPYASASKTSATTPRVSLDYAVTNSTNLYATVAKGFRLGGPTGPDTANVPGGDCDQDYANFHISGAPLTYGPDSLWSYEVGTKGQYFDNHLSVSAAGYYIDWRDIQQNVTLPICGEAFIANAGDAKIYGSELEITAVPSPGLQVGVAAGTTHGYLTSTLYPGVFSVGENLLNVPAFTVTSSLDYETHLTKLLAGFVRLDVPWIGRSHAYYDSAPVIAHWDPAYTLVNASIGVDRGKFHIELYAKNLLDSRKIIQYPSVDTVQEGYAPRPLTVGIMASFSYK